MTTKYAVIPAQGFYGDFAGVISTHSSLAAAKRNAKPEGIMRFAVVEVATTTRKGDKIHRTDVREVR